MDGTVTWDKAQFETTNAGRTIKRHFKNLESSEWIPIFQTTRTHA